MLLTALYFTDFGLNLEIVGQIKSKRDLNDAQVELKDFVVTMSRLDFFEFP